MAKKRPYTHAERDKIYRLCVKGRLGRLNGADEERVSKLYKINPDEYGGASKGAREEADSTVNPMLGKKGDQ